MNGLSSAGAGSALAALGVGPARADEADEPEAVALGAPLFASRSSFCSRFVAAVEGERASDLRQKRNAPSTSPAACFRRAISSERVLWCQGVGYRSLCPLQ